MKNAKDAKTIARLAKDHNMADKTADWIARGLTPNQVRSEILSAKRAAAPAVNGKPLVELNAKEQKQYSIVRAIRAQMDGNVKGAGFELEVSTDIARKLGKETSGIFVPTSLSVARNQNSAVPSAGGNLVSTELSTLVDMLRAKAQLTKLGATIMSGLVGNVAIPRQITGNSIEWIGQNPAAPGVAQTAATVDQILLSPKSAMASTQYTRQLMAQSSVDLEGFVRNDLASAHALGIDRAGFAGLGGLAPTGILATDGVHIVDCDDLPSFDTVVDMEEAVENSEVDLTGAAYVATPGMKSVLKRTPQMANQIALPVWHNNEVNGYKAVSTSQVPSNLANADESAYDRHAMIFGAFEHVLIGEWGAFELIVDPLTQARQGLINVTSIQMVDVQLRYAQAFAAVIDAKRR